MESAKCMVGGGQSLGLYTVDHGWRFPYHSNGYGDEFLMIGSGWEAALAARSYEAAAFARARRTEEDTRENESGRV